MYPEWIPGARRFETGQPISMKAQPTTKPFLRRAYFFAAFAVGGCGITDSTPGRLQQGEYGYSLQYAGGSAGGLLFITAAGDDNLTYRWQAPGFSSVSRSTSRVGSTWALIATFGAGVATHTVERKSSGYQCEAIVTTSTQTVNGVCTLQYHAGSDTIVTAPARD